MSTAISIGLVGIIGFFLFLGWRLRTAQFKDDDRLLMARLVEILFYCLSGIMASGLLYVLMEVSLAAGDTFAPVLRSLFVGVQVILGLIAGLGAIGLGIYLIATLFTRMFRRGRK